MSESIAKAARSFVCLYDSCPAGGHLSSHLSSELEASRRRFAGRSPLLAPKQRAAGATHAAPRSCSIRVLCIAYVRSSGHGPDDRVSRARPHSMQVGTPKVRRAGVGDEAWFSHPLLVQLRATTPVSHLVKRADQTVGPLKFGSLDSSRLPCLMRLGLLSEQMRPPAACAACATRANAIPDDAKVSESCSFPPAADGLASKPGSIRLRDERIGCRETFALEAPSGQCRR